MSVEITVSFHDRVVGVVRSIAEGDVLTYGEVAAEAGHPGAGRAVASALDGDLAWWRVVGAGGRIIAPSATEQIAHLRREGHRIDTAYVPPMIVGW